MKFFCYKKCGTCNKAKKWLKEHNVEVTMIDIDQYQFTIEEITEYYKKSELPIQKLFNTSGQIYRTLNLKDKLKTMSEQEKLEMLASSGMLVKRPVLVTENKVYFGFDEEVYSQLF